ncbi:hypothetical protein DL98DRAFT_576346 [Cadophora sp. DSE1049]|nr:hypothetical protein DL98DRAFT_576346 [Cadophora sp. DSE1049]
MAENPYYPPPIEREHYYSAWSPRPHSRHTSSAYYAPPSFSPRYNSKGYYATAADSRSDNYEFILAGTSSRYNSSGSYVTAFTSNTTYQEYDYPTLVSRKTERRASQASRVYYAATDEQRRHSMNRRLGHTSNSYGPRLAALDEALNDGQLRRPVRKRSAQPQSSPSTASKDHRIPPGYSLKNWDPSEEPIIVLGSSVDTNIISTWLKPWSTLFPPRPKPRLKRPSNRRKALRIKIKDTSHLAIPDSGSEENIMKKRWFYILPSYPVPLIVGMPFLKETEILSKNQHLLQECPLEMSNISSLLWIGSPRQKISCELDGHQLTATADTGSDLNLMSLKCAKREGFTIDRRRESRRRIRVGDGSETETIGMVHVYNLSLDWRKEQTPILNLDFDTDGVQASDAEDGESQDGDEKGAGVTFHVLPNLPCDLIFGRGLLEQTDAFNLCPSLSSSSLPIPLEGDTSSSDTKAFHVLISLGPVSLNIPISRRKRRAAALQVDGKEQHDNARHAEMFRRSTREDEICLLPVSEQGVARVRELRRARKWDVQHASCLYCTPV